MPAIPSEQYVQELFRQRYSIDLRKIPTSKKQGVKTVDFEYIVNGQRVFVCELKEFQRVEPSESTGWKITRHPDGTEEATRKSNALNRIIGHIERAYPQLEKYPEPKVLIFLNNAEILDIGDFEEVFRGFVHLFDDGNIRYINVTAKKLEKNIREFKTKIDLYIWIDPLELSFEGSKYQAETFFETTTEIGRKIAHDYFRVL